MLFEVFQQVWHNLNMGLTLVVPYFLGICVNLLKKKENHTKPKRVLMQWQIKKHNRGFVLLCFWVVELIGKFAQSMNEFGGSFHKNYFTSSRPIEK